MPPKSRRKKPTAINSSDAGSDHEAPAQPMEIVTNVETTKELCPMCNDNEKDEAAANTSKEDWVRCDACKVWFHWRCAGEGGDLELVDKWFCKPCRDADTRRIITQKPPARKSTRKKALRDYASLHNGIAPQTSDNGPGTAKWLAMLEEKERSGAIATPDSFRRMKGNELTVDWLNEDEDAFKEPIVFENTEGLGMKMPIESLTVDDVAKLVGEETPVEVMDVSTQSNLPGYSLGKWAAYFRTPASERSKKILNVISLEVSDTDLGAMILPPRVVREIDWVEKHWPANKRGKGHAYPKVQLYCLMGVANAWTDWHIDFAGSSVYYHIFRGAKVFYFIKPTPANLAAYERWSGSSLQTSTWLGDLVDEVVKVELKAGNTMIIPTGWIHAVYTAVDTLVFGGNFLHSYNIPTQLRVREIEASTHVPKKFRFPFFKKLCWYVADSTLRSLKAREDFSPRVLESLKSLCTFLMNEVHLIERGDEQRKKEAREQVPGDRIRDAQALARELRWRLHVAAHGTSDSEGSDGEATGSRTNGVKRRRGHESKEEREFDDLGSRFKNFIPKKWDAYKATSVAQDRTKKCALGAVEGAEWTKAWMEWNDGPEKMEVDDSQEAEVDSRHEIIIRVRKTTKGLERQKIERTVENWEWTS